MKRENFRLELRHRGFLLRAAAGSSSSASLLCRNAVTPQPTQFSTTDSSRFLLPFKIYTVLFRPAYTYTCIADTINCVFSNANNTSTSHFCPANYLQMDSPSRDMSLRSHLIYVYLKNPQSNPHTPYT